MTATMLVALAGCAGNEPAPAAPAAAKAETIALTKGEDSGKVDRVGATDGALGPDGKSDLSFAIDVEGPIRAVFLAAVDDEGKANGSFQADTVVGEGEVPSEIAVRWGKATAGLGVFEGGKLLNRPDGSLPLLEPGKHRLSLYVTQSPALAPGTKVRVWVQRRHREVAFGSILTLD